MAASTTLGPRSATGGRAIVRRPTTGTSARAGPRPRCSTPPCTPQSLARHLPADQRPAAARAPRCSRSSSRTTWPASTPPALPRITSCAGFERMRELWSDPRWRTRPADAVVEQCLFAPPSVLRQATMPGATIAGRRGAAGHARRPRARRRAGARPRSRCRTDDGDLGAVSGRGLRAGLAARRLGTRRRRGDRRITMSADRS